MIKKITALFLVLTLCLAIMPLEAFAEAFSDGIKNGEVYFDEETNTVYNMDESVTEVNIPASFGGVPVKHITEESHNSLLEGALYGKNLKKASFAEGIETLGCGTFWGCSALESVTLPESLKLIDYRSFCGCISLKKITIPGNVDLLGNEAFLECRALEKVELEEGIGEISYNAFSGCNKLKEIKLPSSITYLASGIFRECTSLTKINIPSNISEIEEKAFYDCKKLSTVTMEEGIVSIENDAFTGCTSLKKVICPRSISYIGSYAFEDNEDTIFYVYKDSYAAEALQGRTLYYIDGTPDENGPLNGNEDVENAVEHLREEELVDDFEEIDIFGKNKSYLHNERYKEMCENICYVTHDITWVRSKFSEIKAAVKTLMKDSWIEIIKRMISGYTGKYTREHEMEEQIAFDLVLSLGKEMKPIAELTKNAEDDAEYISKAYEIAETGIGTTEDMDDFVNLVSNHSGLSRKKVRKVIKDTGECFENANKALRFAEAGMDTINTILIGADMLRIQEETVDILLKRTREKTPLHYGLSRLNDSQKKIWSKNVIEELMTDNVLNMVDELTEEGAYVLIENSTGKSIGLTVAAVELAFYGISYIIPDADYESIYRAIIYNGNLSALSGAYWNIEQDMILASKNNEEEEMEQLKKEYEIVVSAIFTNLRKTVESCLVIAKEDDKRRLEEVYYPIEEYMNYEAFIYDCMNNAREGAR